ncbi:MAG: hypothetical protein KC635_05195 [Myxococcales bacterium]|nr:hypothetical protein [Myxococcales bacterium]MCB9732894.1 hypothetical protein [Deltaproteobacteria bacterium]
MSDHDDRHTAGEAARKAELEALFREWDVRDGEPGGDVDDEPGGREGYIRQLRYGVRLRLIVSCVLLLVTGFVMYSTRHELGYLLESDTPQDLGSLRERWIAGERTLPVEDNSYVSLGDLVITRVFVASQTGDDGKPVPQDQAESVFFCPLFNVIVQTHQQLPARPWNRLSEIELDSRLIGLVRTGLADASDLALSFSGTGRLVRGDTVPKPMKRFVALYHDLLFTEPGAEGAAAASDPTVDRRSRTDRPTLASDEIWVLVDGEKPSDKRIFGILWAFAPIVPLVSLFFLLRAIRSRRRADQGGTA